MLEKIELSALWPYQNIYIWLFPLTNKSCYLMRKSKDTFFLILIIQKVSVSILIIQKVRVIWPLTISFFFYIKFALHDFDHYLFTTQQIIRNWQNLSIKAIRILIYSPYYYHITCLYKYHFLFQIYM
jgi:hypothetical protein